MIVVIQQNPFKMPQKKILVILSTLLFSVTHSFSQDPNFHIYLCFGQSNMSGQGTVIQADRTVNPRFQVLRAASHSGQQVGQFYPAVPPLGHSGSQMGPSDFFGRKMLELMPENITIAVTNISIGGQSISLFDKSTKANYISQARNNNEWWIQYLDQYGGDLYNRIIEMGEVAKQKGVIKGILFHQGEADYNNNNWSSQVKKVYEDILQDLNLNAAEVPFLMGELLTTEQGGDLGWRNAAVAQTAASIPNAHVISAADCPGLVEPNYTLHFTREGYQLLGERYAEKMAELVTFESGFPTVSITNPLTNLTIEVGEEVTLSANASDEDGTIVSVNFYEDETLISSSSNQPYVSTWTATSAGDFTIQVVATDNEGKESRASVNIHVNRPQSPFNGSAHPIPGRIEAEEYDLGGEGIAYHEANSNGNQGGGTLRNDEVDIEVCTDSQGGFNVGYTLTGEWLEYSVDVANTQFYDLELRVAKDGNGGLFHIEIDDVDITGPIAVPNTGGWQIWETVLLEDVSLTAGEHIMKIVFDTDYTNLNYINFKDMITALNDFNNSGLRLFPNPFTEDGIHVEVEGEFNYQISSLSGEIVEKGQVSGEKTLGTQLQAGSYFLSLIDPHNLKRYKIIKL